MPLPEPFYNLLGINLFAFSKIEKILLEADLYARILEELKKVYREEQKDYFYSMKLTKEKENIMLEKDLGRLIIRDILLSDQYTAEGIAHYTDSHAEVIHNIATDEKVIPSATLLRRLIELHREVRSNLYCEIFKKIREIYLTIS